MQFRVFAQPQSALRDAVTAAYRRDETECVQALLAAATLSAEQLDSAQKLARLLVTEVRRERSRANGVDALMHEFSLDCSEGVALMCLAEALLRIPDQATADKLIRDKISHGDWKSHLGHSSSLFVNAAAWGLLLSNKLVSSHSERGLSAAMGRLIAKGGEPLIRKGVDAAMRMLGKQFVLGENIDQALQHSREREVAGYRFSYDMLGEAAMTETDAQRYLQEYITAIHAVGKAAAGRGVYAGPGVSVKLSALHPRYSRAQRERVMAELLPRLKSLFVLAQQYGIGLNIDAEEADRLELSLDLLEALALDEDLRGFAGIGVVVQAYQKRCPYVIDYLIDLARRSGHRFMVRLVKGAYWDAEIKRAQTEGLSGYPVYTRKAHTDVAYLACARRLLAAQDAVYPQFATHNAYSLAAIVQLGQGKEYEFQCLHGMGEALYDQVVGGGSELAKPCRIYAPVGSHQTLLAYLVRRLLENGANSSFVNRIIDETVALDDLLADPVMEAVCHGGEAHHKIPLPVALYGATRSNAKSLDLSNEHVLSMLQRGLSASEQHPWGAFPLLGDGDVSDGPVLKVINPADHADIVGKVIEASREDVNKALTLAEKAVGQWASTPVAERAACLQRMAALLESHLPTLMGLMVREAGKTLPNALHEVREAVDFCRYYALQLQTEFADQPLSPLGPVVCISPWNFPLAIFVGQVVAALAAGNAVLAKPAEQSCLIAAYAVRLLHQAGVPRAILQLLPGRGEVVGAALTADTRVQGVLFTGSTEVARTINRTLAKRGGDAVLVAETGGQNAMIVDSSALPEQVVADVLLSAFDSAGQRCSALRVLYLQEEIADKVLTMLKGAMTQLAVGNPARLNTDIGPVIDEGARAMLLAHIEDIQTTATSLYQTALPGDCTHGTFVAPTLVEITTLHDVRHEVFGPILHVLRFKASELAQVITDINATGYGLTHGIHSRIDETIEYIVERIKAGNIYVNRNMVGAVVGVQPFGGEGKSGTGPKAGGPFYLPRLSRSSWQAQWKMVSTAELQALDALAKLADILGLSLDEQFAAARRATPLGQRIALPGPTGESNTLYFVPRGKVACVADNQQALVAQLVAVFATGNQVVLPENQMGQWFAAQLPGQVELSEDVYTADIHALLWSGDTTGADQARVSLAARSGALLPLLLADEAGVYPLHRLVLERVLSVNTTAAGGNASLMSMSE
ncbi:bifunctional proline dehydrogenase/L-glutamate gamma-semialdehyde dehydrogenase PutA [Neisseriaceae bacterium TC5R-5]|nr:bifunctional proline dehydrogenase/L-glutamate gamma-semialdehyde dehydrogenase PutA [Neisseriaceae bacterium TC5R-5]